MLTTQRFSEKALVERQNLEALTEKGVYSKETSRSDLKPVRDDGGKLYRCYEYNHEYKDKDGNLAYTIVEFVEKDGDYRSFYINAYENGFLTRTF